MGLEFQIKIKEEVEYNLIYIIHYQLKLIRSTSQSEGINIHSDKKNQKYILPKIFLLKLDI